MIIAIVVMFEVILLEMVLGLSNIWFTEFLGERLSIYNQEKARTLGLIIAWVIRILVLIFYSFFGDLYFTITVLSGIKFYWIDVLLLLGGAWLLIKTINVMLFTPDSTKSEAELNTVLLQGTFISMVLSVDAVRTAFHYIDNAWIASLVVFVTMLASSFLSKKIVHRLHIQTKGLVLLLFSTGLLLLLEAFHLPILSELICFGAVWYLMNRFLIPKYGKLSNTKTR